MSFYRLLLSQCSSIAHFRPVRWLSRTWLWPRINRFREACGKVRFHWGNRVLRRGKSSVIFVPLWKMKRKDNEIDSRFIEAKPVTNFPRRCKRRNKKALQQGLLKRFLEKFHLLVLDAPKKDFLAKAKIIFSSNFSLSPRLSFNVTYVFFWKLMTFLPSTWRSWGLHLISITSSSGNFRPDITGNRISRQSQSSFSSVHDLTPQDGRELKSRA